MLIGFWSLNEALLRIYNEVTALKIYLSIYIAIMDLFKKAVEHQAFTLFVY